MKFIFEDRNIKAICPHLDRDVEVLDDWYPSYIKNGKKYVSVFVSAADATRNPLMKKYYNSAFIGRDGRAYRYAVTMLAWGADDTGYEKIYYTNDLLEAIGHYRRFKKMLNKLQKSHPKDLKWFLMDNGFYHA